jgi:hypothetical protein
MPRITKKRKTYRKKSAKRKSPVKRAIKRTLKKPRTGNFAQVKLIRPISRKPFKQLTRHVYYTKAIIQNRVSQVTLGDAPDESHGPVPGFQQMQYCTLHLNTPGVFNNLQHIAPSKCSWTWQDDPSIVVWPNDGDAHYLHDPAGVAANPVFLPGFFDQNTRAGVQYLNHCCLHYKLTVTATPLPSECEKYKWNDYDGTANSRTIDNQAGVLFITKHSSSSGSNPSSLAYGTTLQELYKRPFTKYAKFKSGASTQGMNVAGGETNHGTAVINGGARKSASVSMTWKPQRMHGLKDVADNMQMRCQTSSPTDAGNYLTTMQMMNPAELDGITFGIVPEFEGKPAGQGDVRNDDWVPQSCGRVMLSMRVEAVYRHAEPNKQGLNIPPAEGMDTA